MVRGRRSWTAGTCTVALFVLVVLVVGAPRVAGGQQPGIQRDELLPVTDFEAACSKSGLTDGADAMCRQAIAMALGKEQVIQETRMAGGSTNLQGTRLPANVAKAGWLGEEACDHAHGESCMLYVMLLSRGDGVPQDKAQAEALLQFACRNRYARACDALTNDGIAIAANAPRPRRVSWAKEPAAEPLAPGVVANMVKKLDASRPVDPSVAVMQQLGAQRKAIPMDQPLNPDDEGEAGMVSRCLGGAANDCNRLGLGYAQGIGVQRDEARAKYYSAKACEGGVAPACQRIGMAAPQGAQGARSGLSPNQLRSLVPLAAIGIVAIAGVLGIGVWVYRKAGGAAPDLRQPAPRATAVRPAPGAVRPERRH